MAPAQHHEASIASPNPRPRTTILPVHESSMVSPDPQERAMSASAQRYSVTSETPNRRAIGAPGSSRRSSISTASRLCAAGNFELLPINYPLSSSDRSVIVGQGGPHTTVSHRPRAVHHSEPDSTRCLSLDFQALPTYDSLRGETILAPLCTETRVCTGNALGWVNPGPACYGLLCTC